MSTVDLCLVTASLLVVLVLVSIAHHMDADFGLRESRPAWWVLALALALVVSFGARTLGGGAVRLLIFGVILVLVVYSGREAPPVAACAAMAGGVAAFGVAVYCVAKTALCPDESGMRARGPLTWGVVRPGTE